MQTRTKQGLKAILMLLLLLPFTNLALQSSIGVFSDSVSEGYRNESHSLQPKDEADIQNIKLVDNTQVPSEIPNEIPLALGILNPIQVEQSGYSMTGNISARTDTMENTEQTLSIDTEHEWIASTAQVEVTNLEKLYVVNGSFDEGNLGYTITPNGTLTYYPYGWSAVSTNTDPLQVQQVSYEDSNGERFVSVQNMGPETNTGQNLYTHYNGTSVLWNQTISLTPYTNQFLLSFDFLYLKGPIWSNLEGNFSIQVFVDGESVWKLDLPTLTERGIWLNSGTILVNKSISSETSIFMIGLVIDDTFSVDADLDYDDADTIPDGIVNSQYITVLFDDVSFKGATSPSCESVDLQFTIDSASTPIIGSSGSGSGIIENPLFWQTSPLSFSILSNTSISLDYNTILLNHRFLNSTPTTNTLQDGVAYSIAPDQSGILEMFTYLGFIGAYDDLTIRLYHPSDWENFTVFDPFLVDVTLNCSLNGSIITIPNQLLDRFGWWSVSCEVPNYASSAAVERYDSGVTDWVDESIYHSGDSARISVAIGTVHNIPVLSNPVNFSWYLPNCTTWHQDSTIGGFDGNTSSSPVIFGSTNTTAGLWGVSYFWSNGSELAYDCASFALHHVAILEAVYSTTLETVVGQPVSVFLKFRDAENGLYILNDGATVVGNWSGSDVEFLPDVVKNWWQADFDTALVGAGDFTISIVSAAPYFETVPLLITIKSQFLTTLDVPTGPLTPLIYGREYSFDYFYAMSFNGSGIDEATVEITEEGSEWATITNTGEGHYNLSLEPMASQDYSIRITFSKVGYESQLHKLSFLVNDVSVEVDSISTLVGTELLPLDISVHLVESDTRNPVIDANVTIAIYRSGDLLYFDALMVEISPGVYAVTIPMPGADSGTYTVRISIGKPNHVMASQYTATLVPLFDTNVRLFQTLMTYSWQIAIVAAFAIAAVAGQRARKRRNRAKHATALEIKHRFSDANNLLGIVVLHKLSGVPIYSKILKGGFEEGMLSAFITAIMHFRTEFDKRREKDDFIIIPISDIVRAVPTENLICAFITITSASKVQEDRMISYARAIGMMFDEVLSERPTQVVDVKMTKTFEWMFDDFVDGILLKPYQVGEKRLPKKLRCIEDVVNTSDGVDSFLLVNLIRLLETCGIDEDDSYLLVMDAIEQDYIIPIYPNNDFSRSEVNAD